MNWKPAVFVVVIAAGALAQTPTPTPTPPQTPTPTPAPPQEPSPASIPEGTQLPSEVASGASITVPMRNITAADRIAVVLNDAKRDYAASAKLEGNSVVFTLPNDAQPGRYTVRILVNEKTVLPVPGELRVAGPPQATPVITGISTPIYPPDEGGSLYSFTSSAINSATSATRASRSRNAPSRRRRPTARVAQNSRASKCLRT